MPSSVPWRTGRSRPSCTRSPPSRTRAGGPSPRSAAPATWSRPEGGYFIWLDLPAEAGDLLVRAEAAGVTFVKGTDFFADGSGTKSLRLAFSFVSPDEITDGIEKLAGLVLGAPAPASAL